MTITTIFLVDDHNALLDGLQAAFSAVPNIMVVGTASSYDQALHQISDASFSADIIVTDHALGSARDGIDLCKEAKRLKPSQRVVLLTMHHSSELRYRAQRAGVDHYMEKSLPIEQIVEQLEAVMRGDQPYLQMFEESLDEDVTTTGVSHELSNREIEILYLIACEELTTRQIAERLCRSVQTIETHRSHLFQKLDVASVVGLVKYAMSRGICTNNDHYSGNA